MLGEVGYNPKVVVCGNLWIVATLEAHPASFDVNGSQGHFLVTRNLSQPIGNLPLRSPHSQRPPVQRLSPCRQPLPNRVTSELLVIRAQFTGTDFLWGNQLVLLFV